MRSALLVFVLSLILNGCGLSYGSFNPETKQATFILGKEYREFVFYYESDGTKVYVLANEVQAIEGQKEILKGVVKGLIP